MPETPQMTLLDVKKPRLFSELYFDDGAPHLICKAGRPTKEAHGGHLYSGSHLFSYDPQMEEVKYLLTPKGLICLFN